jgi:predicted tellurium resistance membrane protein TerC
LSKRQSATSLNLSPDDERRSRMVKYTVAMSVRMVCIVLGVFTQGVLMWIFFGLAIFLPYFAVVLANQKDTPKESTSRAIAPKVTIKSDQFKFDD